MTLCGSKLAWWSIGTLLGPDDCVDVLSAFFLPELNLKMGVFTFFLDLPRSSDLQSKVCRRARRKG